MKLTIIPADGAVYKDNVSYSDLDLSFVPAEVHALQWNNAKGWIEFIEDEDGNKPSNEAITELPSWANGALTAWDAANIAALTPVAQPNSQGTQTL